MYYSIIILKTEAKAHPLPIALALHVLGDERDPGLHGNIRLSSGYKMPLLVLGRWTIINLDPYPTPR